VFIENDVRIGNRVTIKCGVQLWDGLRVKDDVFIGPNVSFSNDKYPRSKEYPEEFQKTILECKCSIGAGAVVLPGITIGQGSMIGAGAVVTRNVPPYAVVVGNPARIIGYGEIGLTDSMPAIKYGLSKEDRDTITVKGVLFKRRESFVDLRGKLTVAELPVEIPFKAERLFIVYGTDSNKVRGEHAHKVCEQFLICTSGSVNVVADDGLNRQEFILDDPCLGLYIPKLVWATQYNFTVSASLLVLASHAYDNSDYIRNYSEFLSYVKLNHDDQLKNSQP